MKLDLRKSQGTKMYFVRNQKLDITFCFQRFMSICCFYPIHSRKNCTTYVSIGWWKHTYNWSM